ncbi:hypothetical protein JAAARDRAFT_198530 [Jaapia argillacea MUCL 33604]|uniref:Uncharacterized protein n=1 Tax=Jaapia argillacea MUCL 33604 TaxID=933084 RepID=A0A067PP55_9AGAM|nr:hypothetical protein JAAARDRAFT_198530 [Jaapia argillacea MUCL 33604]
MDILSLVPSSEALLYTHLLPLPPHALLSLLIFSIPDSLHLSQLYPSTPPTPPNPSQSLKSHFHLLLPPHKLISPPVLVQYSNTPSLSMLHPSPPLPPLLPPFSSPLSLPPFPLPASSTSLPPSLPSPFLPPSIFTSLVTLL